MHGEIKKSGIPSGLKPKDLIGIPWRVAFALQAEGWYLRQDIIWAKTNPMPESVKDRCCKSHEYIFLFSKSKNYYFNHEIIREPAAYDGRKDTVFKGSEKYSNTNLIFHERGHERWQRGVNGEYLRNKRSVWSVNNKSYKGVHFATFPDTLIEPCILAGSKEQSIVLDPFAGSGTVGEVCRIHNRNYILIELNPDYEKLIYERTLYETNSISNW
jgi:site-specific DNA-methyltransferase (adenine-specific)